MLYVFILSPWNLKQQYISVKCGQLTTENIV